VGIAVGSSIGGFAMTVLLGVGLWWMWKRRNPWWENARSQNSTGPVDLASPKLDEEKASRSAPSRPSSSFNHSTAPRTYEVCSLVIS
jgi:hypothetical protein